MAARRAWYACSSAEPDLSRLGSDLVRRTRACCRTWVAEIDAGLQASQRYPENELDTRQLKVGAPWTSAH